MPSEHERGGDWRSLGIAHRRRDEATASIAERRGEIEDVRRTGALVRWPAIVRAIETAIAAYNEGVGRDLLVVTHTTDRRAPSVTIAGADGTIPTLLITLDDAELNIDSCSTEPGAGGIKRWVDLTRSDDDTAAYVLQEWMERL